MDTKTHSLHTLELHRTRIPNAISKDKGPVRERQRQRETQREVKIKINLKDKI